MAGREERRRRYTPEALHVQLRRQLQSEQLRRLAQHIGEIGVFALEQIDRVFAARRHEDVDAFVWRRDEDAIRAALAGAGWEHHGRQTDVLGTRYEFGNAELELTFLESGDDGSVFVPVPGNPFVWPTNPFGDDRREFAGVSARLMPLEMLRGGKSAPREGAIAAAKDRADLEALSRLG